MTLLEAITALYTDFTYCTLATEGPLGTAPDPNTIMKHGDVGSYAPSQLRFVMIDCEVSFFTQGTDRHPPIRWRVKVTVFTNDIPRSPSEVWFLGNATAVNSDGWPTASLII